MTHPHPRIRRVYVVEWHRIKYGQPETTSKIYRQRAAARTFMARLADKGCPSQVWTVEVNPDTWAECIVHPWGIGLPLDEAAS